MSTVLRSLSRQIPSASRSIRPVPATVRAFHSPFAVLGNSSPLTSPPPPSSNVYAKDSEDTSYDAFINSKTYVVCQPDPSNTFHEVPSGAYPTSAPYVNWAATETLQRPDGASASSKSSNPFAHPIMRSAS